MKFLVDAHLPSRLARWLQKKGYESYHTLDLPERNETVDMDIIALATKENYVVISKDQDFFQYYILKQKPPKLILLTTGNLPNSELISLFEENFPSIIRLLEENSVLELNHNTITIHF